jgi:uncharacterized protein YqeY
MINIDELISQSIKEKDNIKTKVYRNIKAEILKYKTAKNAKPYDDIAEISILKRIQSQYNESIEAFRRGNRDDLAASEDSEVQILNQLIPKPVELNVIEDELLSILEDDGMDNIPKSKMGYFINTLKGLFPYNNGKDISDIVKNYVV